MSTEMREKLVNAVKDYNKMAGAEVHKLKEVYESMDNMSDEEAQKMIWVLEK